MPEESAVMCGAAVSGRMLAWTTLAECPGGVALQRRGTRLFHLSDRSHLALRQMPAEMLHFIQEEGLSEVAFCRTETGYDGAGMADEIRIETLLHFIPQLKVTVYDDARVRDWACHAQPGLPRGCSCWPSTLVEIRAIEIAQFELRQRELERDRLIKLGGGADDHD